MEIESLEHLNQVLEDKDSQIQELERQVERLKEAQPWHTPEERDTDGGLPVPRLEMVWVSDGIEATCTYFHISRHFLGHIEARPFGQTVRRGGFNPKKFDLPFRDGAHIRHDAEQLKLAAFVRTSMGSRPIDFGEDT